MKMAEFGVMQIKQEPLDQELSAPDFMETFSENSSQNHHGNKNTDRIPQGNSIQHKKMNHNKKLHELLLGIIPERKNQSTETCKNTNQSKDLSQTLYNPGNDSQNINQLADSLQKENSGSNLEGYQMYIKSEVEDASYLHGNRFVDQVTKNKGDNCDIGKIRPFVLESTHQLQEKEVEVTSNSVAVVGCGKSHYTHIQTPCTGTHKSNQVSNLQKSHKRLSGLLSCNNTNGSGNFDLLASSSSLLSPVLVSHSSSLPSNLTADCSVEVMEKRDKNGELLQMLLTKGPSSYVRDSVSDVSNFSADLSNLTQVNYPLMKSSSPTSSSSLRNILGSGSSKTDLFVPKTSSPALRKILSASSCSKLPSSHLQQDNVILPVQSGSENPQNLSTNLESSFITSSTSVQGHTTLTTSSGGRLESTIKKLLAKQADDHVTPNITISQGVRDLLNKTATDVTNCSSNKPMTCNTPTAHSSNNQTNYDKSHTLLHVKQEPVDENDGKPEQNVNELMHWIDEVSSRLVDKLIKSEDGNEPCSMLTNGRASHVQTESEGELDIVENLGKKLSARKKTVKSSMKGASEANLLDNKKLEDSSFSKINNNVIDQSDKYKILQQHLLVKPPSSSQINYSVKPVVNVPSVSRTAVKRKDEDRISSSTTNKKKNTDEDWMPPGMKKSSDGEPVKRPFMEMPLFYKCYDCGKAFEHKGTLKVHERMHSMEKQEFKCDICGKVCSAKGYLEIHMRTHLRELPSAGIPNLSFVPSKPPKEPQTLQTCTLCGKSFVEAENLLIHMRMHSGEKLYKCEICGNGFTRKTQLAIHMRIHTGEKPYECEVCGKTFRQSNGLNLHMTTHTDDKPYKCEICGGGFGRKAHYEKHMRKHRGERPFLCGVCSKGFTDKFTLSMHMKIHNKTKDHVCQVCGKGYNQSTHLRNHMQFHSGDKGYHCDECNKLFEHKRTLKNHIKTAHSESYQAALKSKRQIRDKRRAALRKKASVIKDEKTDELSRSASDDENRDSEDGSLSSGEDSDQEMIAYTQVKEEPLDVYTAEVDMENIAEDANSHDTVYPETNQGETIEDNRMYTERNQGETIEDNRMYPERNQGETIEDNRMYTERNRGETIEDNRMYPERNQGETIEDNRRSSLLSPVENIKQEIIHRESAELSYDVNSGQIASSVNELNASAVGSDFIHFTIKEEPVDNVGTFSMQNSNVTF